MTAALDLARPAAGNENGKIMMRVPVAVAVPLP